jgi:WYL_2, Sm-like SH3 beta-barrel fold
MSLSENDLVLFKKWLKGHLNSGPVTVTFTKKDGNERIMKCTTNPTLIMFKNTTNYENKTERKGNEEVMPVYDLEAEHWKSFRWDSIKHVSFTIGAEHEHHNKA